MALAIEDSAEITAKNVRNFLSQIKEMGLLDTLNLLLNDDEANTAKRAMLQGKAIKAWLNNTIGRAYRAWFDLYLQELHDRKLALKSLKRMQKIILYRAFNKWLELARACITDEMRAERAMTPQERAERDQRLREEAEREAQRLKDEAEAEARRLREEAEREAKRLRDLELAEASI